MKNIVSVSVLCRIHISFQKSNHMYIINFRKLHLVSCTVLSMHQVGEYAIQTGVELVEALDGPVIVAVTQGLPHKVLVVQDVIGNQLFLLEVTK